MRSTKVFVADAGSTDGTQQIALSYSDRLMVEVIPGGMPSVGRNAGAAHAETDYVLFLDADVELADSRLIRRALRRITRRRLHCLTTDIKCRNGSWLDDLLYTGNNRFQRLSSWVLPFGTGMFLLFDKRRFDALGGFDEKALFAEDYLLTKQISPRRFSVIRGGVLTSNRRFKKTGKLRMVFLFFWTLANSFNRKHFQDDHGYWVSPEREAES